MQRTKFDPDRRRALKKVGGTIAMTAASSLAGVSQVLADANRDRQFADDKSLVCIFLFGGNDQWNTLTPYSSNGYERYRRIRGSLALPYDSLLSLGDGSNALHPALTGTRQLFSDRKLAFVRNVGNLIEPATRGDYLNGRVAIPSNLFSHNHQQEMSFPGWGGRIADMVVDANRSQELPPSFTLFGSNNWQSGTRERTKAPFDISPAGVGVFTHFNFDSWPPQERLRSAKWLEIMRMDRKNLLERQLASMMLSTNARLDAIRDEIGRAPDIATPFSQSNPLAMQLRMVAKLISIREQLGLKRQIFMVGHGSFDTHGGQLAAHQTMLGQLDDALVSFQAATEELGVQDSVLSFTASEFGRTLTSNGDGTDHAWSSDYLVMGGGVRGGEILGRPVALYAGDRSDTLPNGEQAYGVRDVGSGRFIPNHAVEEYGATLARWMGLTETQIDTVFPNLQNFSSRGIAFLA